MIGCALATPGKRRVLSICVQCTSLAGLSITLMVSNGLTLRSESDFEVNEYESNIKMFTAMIYLCLMVLVGSAGSAI